MDRTINTELLWSWSRLLWMQTWTFSFNWRNLDNWNSVRVISSNHDDLWSIDFQTYNTPLQDWWWVLWKYYRSKTITIVLSVSAWNAFWLNALIDEIKYETSKTEWILKIIINDVVRERTATCTSLKFNRQSFNVDRCGNVVLTFSCVNPHSHLVDRDSISFDSLTWTYLTSLMYEWKAESFPTLYIEVDSWSSSWMSFTLNWYTIAITTSLTAWDIIIFDWEKKSVFVNNVEVAYTWPFTPLNYGENVYAITNSWTYTWTLSYFTKFL